MILESSPLPQVAESVTMLVAPPAPALHTKLTVLPVRPTPEGLMIVRSPAESPLALESTPDKGVTGWPDSARYVPPHSHPWASALTNAWSVRTFGISYRNESANLCLMSRADKPRSAAKSKPSCARRGFTRLLNSSLVALSMFLENV